VIPKRLAPIFRDRDELASSTDLGRKVNEALAQSASLIVICSPRSASSRWVEAEVLAFKRLGRSDSVFCLIIDGEPNASDQAVQVHAECFAPAHFIDGLVKGFEDGGGQGFCDIADAASDEPFGGIGVCFAELIDAPADLGKEITRLELEVIAVDPRHESLRKPCL